MKSHHFNQKIEKGTENKVNECRLVSRRIGNWEKKINKEKLSQVEYELLKKSFGGWQRIKVIFGKVSN